MEPLIVGLAWGIGCGLPFLAIGLMVRMMEGASKQSKPLPKQWEEQFKSLRSEIEALRSTTTQHALSLQSRLEALDQRMHSLEERVHQLESTSWVPSRPYQE